MSLWLIGGHTIVFQICVDFRVFFLRVRNSGLLGQNEGQIRNIAKFWLTLMFFGLTAARALALQIPMGFRSFLFRVWNSVPLGKLKVKFEIYAKFWVIFMSLGLIGGHTIVFQICVDFRGFFLRVRNSGLLGQNEGHIRNLRKILSLTSKTWIIIAIWRSFTALAGIPYSRSTEFRTPGIKWRSYLNPA